MSFNGDVMEKILVPNTVFFAQVELLLKEGKEIVFYIKGNSMRPFLESGRDEVILKNALQVRIGDVILAFIEKRYYVLHRVIDIQDEHFVLQGDGNCHTEICSIEDVLGKAIGFYRKNKKAPYLTSGRKWRFYSFCWMHLSPFRRFLLAFYHRIWLKIFPIQIHKKQSDENSKRI